MKLFRMNPERETERERETIVDRGGMPQQSTAMNPFPVARTLQNFPFPFSLFLR